MAILDMDEVVRILRDEHKVPAYVEQTGGGTATIYVGEQFDHEEPTYRWTEKGREQVGTETWKRYPVLAGPGWFEGPGWTNARADLGDFYIGPDDDGESDPVVPDREGATPADIAALILRQLKS